MLYNHIRQNQLLTNEQMFAKMIIRGDLLHIINFYCDAIPNDNHSTKARDDVFIPTTKPSKNYKIWHALLDLKTCFDCADKHGRIFLINDTSFKEPPLHIGCRCTLEETEAVEAGSATHNGTDGADYWLKHYGELPEYYISPEQLGELGWEYGDKPSKFAPGRMLGGRVYDNGDRNLPDKINRIWYEADINYTPGRRNLHRIVWSNDGLIFVTYDHYHTFYEII